MVLPEVIGILICLLAQGLFSGSEIAIVSCDRLVLKARSDEGDRGAARVLELLERPTLLVGTCLIGTALSSATGSTLVVHLLRQLGDLPDLLAIAIYAPLTVVFSELIPKSLFHQYAITIAPVAAQVLGALSRALLPVLWLLEKGAQGLLRLVGVSDAQVNTVRREDIRILLDSVTTGDIRAEEKEMILRVFNFSDIQVQDVMVPLIEIVGIADTATCEEAAALMAEHGHSRLPVYRKRIDRIIGSVGHSDVLFQEPGTLISVVVRPILFVPESQRIDKLFVELRRRRTRLAVAVDEYGGAVGMVSVEDILEEIVGEIDDEYSRRRPPIRRTGEREWLASGRVERDHLHKQLGLNLPQGDYDTLAGFLLEQFGRVPQMGERLTWGTFSFTISKANERAITEVTIQSTAPTSPKGRG